MKTSAVAAAIGVGLLATALAKTSSLPAGWLQTGDAKTCEGQVVSTGGASTAKVFSLDCKPGTAGFSTLMQQVAGTDYAGKRVRLSAQLRGDQLAAWGGLWMRADSGPRTSAFDNMQDRPLIRSFGWQISEVVLDVPVDATALSFGFLLAGAGQLQATQFKLEIVSDAVPVTRSGGMPTLPHRPVNLTPQ